MAEGSALVYERIVALSEWNAAGSVFLFAPLAGEPALERLMHTALAGGKRVALPAFDAGTGIYCARQVWRLPDQLVVGKFGAREPLPDCPVVPVGTLDFAVVPGLAFTSDGKRLGRGRGFYDRLLASFRGVSCGAGFDEQIVAGLPVEPHDVKLSYVATPARLWIGRPTP